MEKAEFDTTVNDFNGIEHLRLVVTASAGQYSIFSEDGEYAGRYVVVEREAEHLELVDLDRDIVVYLRYSEIELIMGGCTAEQKAKAIEIRKTVLDKLRVRETALQETRNQLSDY